MICPVLACDCANASLATRMKQMANKASVQTMLMGLSFDIICCLSWKKLVTVYRYKRLSTPRIDATAGMLDFIMGIVTNGFIPTGTAKRWNVSVSSLGY